MCIRYVLSHLRHLPSVSTDNRINYPNYLNYLNESRALYYTLYYYRLKSPANFITRSSFAFCLVSLGIDGSTLYVTPQCLFSVVYIRMKRG